MYITKFVKRFRFLKSLAVQHDICSTIGIHIYKHVDDILYFQVFEQVGALVQDLCWIASDTIFLWIEGELLPSSHTEPIIYNP